MSRETRVGILTLHYQTNLGRERGRERGEGARKREREGAEGVRGGSEGEGAREQEEVREEGVREGEREGEQRHTHTNA